MIPYRAGNICRSYNNGNESRGVVEGDRKEWRALVHMWMIEFNTAFLLGPAFFRTALPRSGRLSPGEGWDAVT